MSQLNHAANRALRAKQVADSLGIGVSSVWRLASNDPEFPKPFKLSPRVTVWNGTEVDAYLAAKAAVRSRVECAS